MTDPVIQLRQVWKSYGIPPQTIPVLRGIDLTVHKGEFLSIMGPSGSGKSTMLNILGLLDDFDSGTYMLADLPMSGITESEASGYRNRLLGFVFQSFHLLSFKSALENVALALYYQGISRKERMERAAAFLNRVGLAHRLHHVPHELSGGEKQRVAIARALVTSPVLILADEPTGSLDSKSSDAIMELLADVNRTMMTVVVVTHDPDIAARTRRVVRVRDGSIESDVHAREAMEL